VAEGAVVGTVTINGKCYQKTQSSDKTEYIYIGSITIGQCYDAFQGGCQPDHCSGNSPGKRCNEQLHDCTVNPPATTSCGGGIKAGEDADCTAIAADLSITEDDLLSMNPDLDCEDLQEFQFICTSMATQQLAGTPKCEGYKVSG
jgi:hypothetical protein